MKNYDFTQKFKVIYDKGVALYAQGQRGAETFFSADEKAWLASVGITSQHLYDYAEDQVGGGEPGYDNALAIELVRRDYFLSAQHGQPSKTVLDESSLAPKDQAVEGITWLPRIIPKAKAKLKGELPASLMYCCGGDRRFFKTNDILPSEFLALIWRNLNDDQATVAWVASRAKTAR